MKIFNVKLTVKGTKEDLINAIENSNFGGMIDTEFQNKNQYTLIGQCKGDINALANFREELKRNRLIVIKY